MPIHDMPTLPETGDAGRDLALSQLWEWAETRLRRAVQDRRRSASVPGSVGLVERSEFDATGDQATTADQAKVGRRRLKG